MIIGLTGYARAGKDFIADYFVQKHNFTKFVFSDILSDVLQSFGWTNSKDNQSKLGVALRKASTPNVLAILLSEKLKGKNNIVISGFRSPEETELFRGTFGENFKLIYVNRTFENRYQTRRDVSLNEEEFRQRDIRDGQHMGLDRIIQDKLYDFEITNNGTIEELESNISRIYEQLDHTPLQKRISWDEYFLKLSMLVAERSTCKRHNIGAIIVRDKHILTTGYNGTVAGSKDCLDLGCLKDINNLASGTGHEICRAVHAEQNAIIQAGLHGIDIKGATIYCTHTPCNICAKMIVNSKIKRVVTYSSYSDKSFFPLFQEAGIAFIQLPKPSRIIRELE